MNPEGIEDGSHADEPRSHRRGMLAGLGAVGLLLVILLLLDPGGSTLRHPITSAQRTAPATIPVPADKLSPGIDNTTTTVAPAAPTPSQTGAGHEVITDPTVSGRRVDVPTPAPPATATPVPTTVPAAAPTTTTTSVAPPSAPASTTSTTVPSTTTTTSCLLILCT